uniref:dihydrofolate reductase n=1 Tax=Plectus sambesii TaxID=2011161 RepID=A0A914VTX8_9BILA
MGSTAHKRMNLIAAMVDSSQGIGLQNSLPWHLPKEYAYFVKMTTRTVDPNKKNAVIMGRLCWESVPAKYRPLKGRINVVLSRTLMEPPAPGVLLAGSLEEAVRLLCSPPLADQVETIWNVGGNAVYEAGMRSPLFHRLYLTRIYDHFETDVFFPPVKWEDYHEIEPPAEYAGEQEEKGVRYRFCVYEKNSATNSA